MTLRYDTSPITEIRSENPLKTISTGIPLFKRAITTERIYFGRPINYVVMMARISGPSISKNQLQAAIVALIPKNPFIISRFQPNPDGQAWLVLQQNPRIQIKELKEKKAHIDDWQLYASQEHMTYFDPFIGPLIRFGLLPGENHTDLVISCHHSICDGMSLKVLIHDIIAQLAEPSTKHKFHQIPPVIDESWIPIQPGSKFQRFLMKILNKAWKRQKIQFSQNDYRKLHPKYWDIYEKVRIQSLDIPTEIMIILKRKCKANNVTIHSLLITALLLAQYELQYEEGNKKKYYLKHTHMPVNMRHKYLKPIGNDFGFYAASFIIEKLYNEKESFWKNAKQFHILINKHLSNSDLFQLLRINSLSPTLVDATYFQKLGVINNKISRLMIKKMGIKNIMVGTALTNLGMDKSPISYSPYRIEAIYGPSVFSELLEKIISAITVNNRLCLTFTYEESLLSSVFMTKYISKFYQIIRNLTR